MGWIEYSDMGPVRRFAEGYKDRLRERREEDKEEVKKCFNCNHFFRGKYDRENYGHCNKIQDWTGDDPNIIAVYNPSIRRDFGCILFKIKKEK